MARSNNLDFTRIIAGLTYKMPEYYSLAINSSELSPI